MITLYDLASALNKPWSPSVWKTRLNLNYKGLPYCTKWVEYPDIAALYLENGIQPTEIRQGSIPYYSLPVIQDDCSGKPIFVADSFEIAKYLDKTYPNTPRVIPEGEEAIQKQRTAPGILKVAGPQALALFCKDTHRLVVNPASQDHLSLARAKDLSRWFPGIKTDIQLSEKDEEEIWKGFKESLDGISDQFGGETGFSWYLGDTISFADFALAAGLIWVREVYGEDSKIWAKITSWNDGKWGELLEKLSEYQTNRS
jgi:glutathione S-transferase